MNGLTCLSRRRADVDSVTNKDVMWDVKEGAVVATSISIMFRLDAEHIKLIVRP